MIKTLQPFLFGVSAVLLAHAAIGCADDGPLSPENGREEIGFAVLGSAFGPADTIIATLVNRSDRAVGYNLCFAELDRRTASGWQQVQRHAPNSVCTSIQLGLAPGESARLMQPVLERFPAGIYRFRVEVEWTSGGERFTVATTSFTIEE